MLNEYQTETQGILAQADIVYKAATTALGIDQATLDLVESNWNMLVKPKLDILEVQLQKEAIDVALIAAVTSGLSSVLDIVGRIAFPGAGGGA